ncbi:DUF2061 domain-containing protein [Candidatus Woesearchaeota archaeon]|nr:DUF2061 domain-containing protein [Candidatus Woesearchaeota archaeon]MBW3005643.1 DUF2061 domain-containing protein [Candidatus Woesearchaeota archaeon]
MADKHVRSIAKSISWRTIATLTTMILVFVFTGKLALAAGIGFFEVIIKLTVYYAHERAWDNITWGRYAKAKAGVIKKLRDLGYI